MRWSTKKKKTSSEIDKGSEDEIESIVATEVAKETESKKDLLKGRTPTWFKTTYFEKVHLLNKSLLTW